MSENALRTWLRIGCDETLAPDWRERSLPNPAWGHDSDNALPDLSVLTLHPKAQFAAFSPWLGMSGLLPAQANRMTRIRL